uniref:Uncharacterized protein n=1 Tax=Sphaerodactylus townsendi TaxID=933632 RepID=A0ACB8EB96_9SAUR
MEDTGAAFHRSLRSRAATPYCLGSPVQGHVGPPAEHQDNQDIFEESRNKKDIQCFLGFSSYYQHFIPQFVELARALSQLLPPQIGFTWTPAVAQAFQELKRRFAAK